MKKNFNKYFLLFFFLIILVFYSPFLFKHLLPIPADTIVGLYHPFRDFYMADYPRGIPFKNFLITDPVRQIFIWKDLSIDSLSDLNLPLWNPYEMAGKPLLGNMQSSPFYPLNLILFIKPLSISWSVFILAQTLFAGLFMYIYLKSLNLSSYSSVLGALAFSFSGFSIAWLEWGNIVHAGLWLPLILFSVDKIINEFKNKKINLKKSLFLGFAFVFSLSSSFLAGNLQVFFYIALITFLNIILRLKDSKYKLKTIVFFIMSLLFFLAITFIQWYQTAIFILNSARDIDRSYLLIEGWFMPVQNLIQFFAPDYFGNPATGNYWGVWNYGEFIGYIGVAPLLIAFFAAFFIRRRIVYFYILLLVFSIIMMVGSPISELPFKFNIPFISTAQPTRIIFITVFALCTLTAFGLDYLILGKIKLRNIIIYLSSFLVVVLFIGVLTLGNFLTNNSVDKDISLRNLVLPGGLFIFTSIIILLNRFIKREFIKNILIIAILLLSAFDLLRFANKFTPFTNQAYLFPNTKITDFLSSTSKKELYRVAVINDEILAPNFLTYYRVQSINGYDPLYLRNYAEFIAAMEKGSADILPPFGFNRIITPKNYNSELFNLLNVKYVLSFQDISSDRYSLVMKEGQTMLFENKKVLPRAFFVEDVSVENNNQKHMDRVLSGNMGVNAVVFSNNEKVIGKYSIGSLKINAYNDNQIEILTSNKGKGFLVLSDVDYPLWDAYIDSSKVEIYRTNYSFRGVIVPVGSHKVTFRMRAI